MGNPHAVTFIDDTDSLEIEKIGPKFETHKLFPKKINTEFAQIVDRNTIKMRVWERGAGETLACGTGACATMVAANLNGLVDDEADLVLLGGTLHIKWDKNENKVYSRENLLGLVWGKDYPGDVRTVDVHVRRLREKIEINPSEPKYVHTKWGVGYYYYQK